jgi:hypothetical protein
MEVVPEVIPAAEVERRAGGRVVCPLCRVQSTSDEADIGWVALPELRCPPRWICLGSWLDVSSVARADEPADHPYHDDVRSLADLTGLTATDVIEALRQRQVAILQADPRTPNDPQRVALLSRLDGLLGHVQL